MCQNHIVYMSKLYYIIARCLVILPILFMVGCFEKKEKPKHNSNVAHKTDSIHKTNYVDWNVYRGDKKGNQFAELSQIHAANVHKLELAWQYRTGDASERSSMQCNPIMIDGLLYFSTSTLKAIALDATTGKGAWVFESSKYNKDRKVFRGRSRGVTYWQSEDGTDRRIFHYVKNRVYAINAKTGELIESFGSNGKGFIDLREHLDMELGKASIEVTSPGIVYKNTLIVASRVPEGYKSTPGHIRAFDAVTGQFKWIFHTIPKEGEFGYDTWEFVEGETYGGANAWGGFTLDEKRGWVFCATGSPAYDFYGGHRKGQNLFGNCVLALNAETGERVWHYQTVHHDLWDYDNPSAPILVSIRDEGKQKDAVVQLTKMGLTFVLDRETGEPIFPVEEMEVPVSTLEGEEASPTQPIPIKPLPLTHLGMTETNLTNVSPEARAAALKKFSKLIPGVLYEPPSEIGTISAPGTLGGVEWQGGSFDPYSNILYVNSNNGASILKMKKIKGSKNKKKLSKLQQGRQLYVQNCASCHGIERQGTPPVYPSLLNLEKSKEELTEVIKNGRNIMPAFPQFKKEEFVLLVDYLSSDKVVKDDITTNEGEVRYHHAGYANFLDHQGYPGVAPPWGTLNGIDLTTGNFVWRKPLGEYPELVKQGIRNTGTMNYGGAVATSGGVIFIAATADEKIRAFEKSRGKLLWEYKLPAGGYATPTIYMKDGKQYVVIVAGGGGKNGTPSSDHVMAFALPDNYLNATKADLQGKKDNQGNQGWISLFDGKTLDGWVHMNGSHKYRVENGAIIGRTTPESQNSFLCSLQEFDDFEFECDVMVDDITNQGIQFRSSARPVTEKDHSLFRAGRVWGPQLEIRRKMGEGKVTTGLIYGEAMGIGFLSSEEKVKNSHDFYISEGWNKIRIVAKGPRIQTFLNGHQIDDVINEEVYKTHPKGFIALQIHGMKGKKQFTMGWKNIRIKPIL